MDRESACRTSSLALCCAASSPVDRPRKIVKVLAMWSNQNCQFSIWSAHLTSHKISVQKNRNCRKHSNDYDVTPFVVLLTELRVSEHKRTELNTDHGQPVSFLKFRPRWVCGVKRTRTNRTTRTSKTKKTFNGTFIWLMINMNYMIDSVGFGFTWLHSDAFTHLLLEDGAACSSMPPWNWYTHKQQTGDPVRVLNSLGLASSGLWRSRKHS